jgi:hypothetical protein
MTEGSWTKQWRNRDLDIKDKIDNDYESWTYNQGIMKEETNNSNKNPN